MSLWHCTCKKNHLVIQIGTLMKRLDIGEGHYTKELEEDYDVYGSMSQVMDVSLNNEGRCEDFKAQFSKFDYLWKKDLNATLQEFLHAEGKLLPDGTYDDPLLPMFEAQITKYKVSKHAPDDVQRCLISCFDSLGC